MSTDLTEARRSNFEEFIDTIPLGVKHLAELIFSYFKHHPASYNFVFSDETIYVYLMDDDFQTTGQIVAYLDADFDHPPFKPYKNTEDDELLGVYDVYLKLNQEILDASGYLDEDSEEDSTEDVDEVSDDSQEAAPQVPTKTRKMSHLRPSDSEKTEEVSHEEVYQAFESKTEDVDREAFADLDDSDSGGTATISVADDGDIVPSVGLASDQEYMDALKLIARDVEQDALEIMQRTHSAVGAIVPLTFVRLGSKLIIRTNQDQPSFDEHYETIRGFAEEVFEEATEVSATKNNVQIIF